MAEILNNDEISTNFIFTDYFIKNNLSVDNIVKVAISDEDIDYGLDKEDIKNSKSIEPSSGDRLNNKLFIDNVSIVDIEYVLRSNGQIEDNNGIIVITDGTYLEFEFLKENEFFIEFLNKNFFKSLKIDDKIVDKFKKDYIYIKQRVRIYFSNIVQNSIITVYSIKRELHKEFNVRYTFTGGVIVPEIGGNTDEIIESTQRQQEINEITKIENLIVGE